MAAEVVDIAEARARRDRRRRELMLALIASALLLFVLFRKTPEVPV